MQSIQDEDVTTLSFTQATEKRDGSSTPCIATQPKDTYPAGQIGFHTQQPLPESLSTDDQTFSKPVGLLNQLKLMFTARTPLLRGSSLQ